MDTDRAGGRDDGPADLRVGDADRAAALEALGRHLEEGRLDVDEFGERSARASVAVRSSDIRALFIDLPAPHPALPQAPLPQSPSVQPPEAVPASRGGRPPARPQREHGLPPGLRAGVLAAAVALPVMLVVAAGPGGGGLLVLPLLVLLLGGLHHGGHRHGPGNRW